MMCGCDLEGVPISGASRVAAHAQGQGPCPLFFMLAIETLMLRHKFATRQKDGVNLLLRVVRRIRKYK